MTAADARRRYLLLASVLGAAAVALGAFGAHALAPRLEARMLEVYDTAVFYHFVHVLALLGVAAAWEGFERRAWLRWGCRLLVAGMLVFCGTLYALALTGIGWLGAVTPLGGTALIAGWLCLARAAMRDTHAP